MDELNLQNFMKRHCEHEAMCTRLNEELGVLHGLSWADFVLLAELDAAGGTQSTSELAQKLGLSRSRFLLQLIPLEKIGLVERIVDENGTQVRINATNEITIYPYKAAADEHGV